MSGVVGIVSESEQDHREERRRPDVVVEANIDAKIKDDFALAQFNSLRTEILQLISMQGQLISANVVALGVLLSIAVQAKNSAIILIYPMVSLILGLTWLNHAHSIVRTSGFLALHESKHLGSEGWESYLRTLDSTLFNKVGYWGVRSAFPGGAVLSVIAALLIGVHGPVAWIAFSISAAIAVGCVVVFVVMREASHEIEDGTASAQAAQVGSRLGGPALPDSSGDAVENRRRPEIEGAALSADHVPPEDRRSRVRPDTTAGARED